MKSFIVDKLKDLYIILEQGAVAQKAIFLYSDFDVSLYNLDIITINPIPLIKINMAIFVVIMGSLSGIELYGKYKKNDRILELSPRFNEATEKAYYFYSLFPAIQKRFNLPLGNSNVIIANFVTACVFGAICGLKLSNPMELPLVTPDRILVPDTLFKKLLIHLKNFLSVYGLTQYLVSSFLIDFVTILDDDMLSNVAIATGLAYTIGQYLLLYHPRYQRLIFSILSALSIASWNVSMIFTGYSYFPNLRYPDDYDGDFAHTFAIDPISISLATIFSLFIIIMHISKIREKIARYTQLHPHENETLLHPWMQGTAIFLQRIGNIFPRKNDSKQTMVIEELTPEDAYDWQPIAFRQEKVTSYEENRALACFETPRDSIPDEGMSSSNMTSASTESSPELKSQTKNQSPIHFQISSQGRRFIFFGTSLQLKNCTATPLETPPEEVDEEVPYSPKEDFEWC